MHRLVCLFAGHVYYYNGKKFSPLYLYVGENNPYKELLCKRCGAKIRWKPLLR